MKNVSASGCSKSQMLPSLLPLPASFFKVLPLALPQKFNRFQLPASTSLWSCFMINAFASTSLARQLILKNAS